MGGELLGQLEGVVGKQLTPDGRATGNHEMNVVGIAGSSAGAIIATLHWAGYDAYKIKDEIEDLFKPIALNDLFGPYHHRMPSLTAVTRFLQRGLDIFFSSNWVAWPIPGRFVRIQRFLARLGFAVWIFLRHRWMFRRMGILAGDCFERRIDTLLKRSAQFRHSVERRPAGRSDDPLTFGEARACCPNLPPLFLMITDLGGGELVTASSIAQEWQGVSMARAVRASAGFPGLFRPVQVGPYTHCVDGGVVSNVPTWVFDRDPRRRLEDVTDDPNLQRTAGLPWHHVALRLAPDPPGAPPTSGAALVEALWHVLSGRGRSRLESEMFRLVATKRLSSRHRPMRGSRRSGRCLTWLPWETGRSWTRCSGAAWTPRGTGGALIPPDF